MESVVPAILAVLHLFGPAAGMALIVAGVVGYLYIRREREYRQDYIRSLEVERQRDRRDERMIDVIERNAASSEKLSHSISAMAERLGDALDRQGRDLADIIREVRR